MLKLSNGSSKQQSAQPPWQSGHVVDFRMCVLQSVAQEIERAEQAQALRKQSAEGKQAADAAEWGAWMRRYLAPIPSSAASQ